MIKVAEENVFCDVRNVGLPIKYQSEILIFSSRFTLITSYPFLIVDVMAQSQAVAPGGNNSFWHFYKIIVDS